MDKELLVIGVISAIGILTIIFGKIIGPKLLDRVAPNFNKATNRIDYMLMGKPKEWEIQMQRIVESNSEQLKPQVASIVPKFATPIDQRRQSLPSNLPAAAKAFFGNYASLSFDGETRILDVNEIRTVLSKGKSYMIIGRSQDDDHFYAIDLQDGRTIVCLEANRAGRVFQVEDDAPSFEHFLMLQHHLHFRGPANAAW